MPLPNPFLFILGLFLGSFFGVLVDRLPFGKNVISGRSQCDYCKKNLAWYDLIPVFSFLFLGARCRFCNKKLSWFYPTIELTTGLLFSISPFISYQLLFTLFIFSCFIVIFFTDLKYKIIPDLIVFSAVIGTFIYELSAMNYQLVLWNYLVSAVGSCIFFLFLFFITKQRGMGFGDVKLSFLLGLFLGFPLIVVGMYTAFLTGALVSIILLVILKYSLKSSVPFGPFLIIGTLVALFWGNQALSLFPYL